MRRSDCLYQQTDEIVLRNVTCDGEHRSEEENGDGERRHWCRNHVCVRLFSLSAVERVSGVESVGGVSERVCNWR